MQEAGTAEIVIVHKLSKTEITFPFTVRPSKFTVFMSNRTSHNKTEGFRMNVAKHRKKQRQRLSTLTHVHEAVVVCNPCTVL